MPSEQVTVIVHDPQQEPQSQQTKFCSLCHTALNDPQLILYPLSDALVCPACSDRNRSTRQSPVDQPRSYRSPQDSPSNNVYQHLRLPHISPHEAQQQQSTRRIVEQSSPSSHGVQHEHHQVAAPSPCHTTTSQPLPPATGAKHHPQLQPLTIGGPCASGSTTKPHTPTLASATTYYPSYTTQQSRRAHRHTQPVYDPLVDITRLRVRSQSHQCLYPGATFAGTQKSGRNSYDVNVTIVDVDFQMSTLCGYLRIRGLTDDWPELTTYFDAEIIGPRYGFLTQNWGATEHEDMVHWARFPAFKHVKHDAKRPHLTIDDRDRGAVFMRWKERFLVPDHRVQDINGASFAGFYYVCVDFNSPSGVKDSPVDGEEAETASSPMKDSRRRRGSSAVRNHRSKSRPPTAPMAAPMAAMSGFYYHARSEPYQQLSLTHTPEGPSSSFEFR